MLRKSVFFFLLFTIPAWGASSNITLYLDGALDEGEETVLTKQSVLPLPQGFVDGSLRIKPLDGCSIDTVEVGLMPSDPAMLREVKALTERREMLNDRLKALLLRESVFSAAAKAQSGKAPRKSKTNPEPLASLRQGTEYAISQLEGVFRSRRTTEEELKSLDGKVSAYRNRINKKVAKVNLSGKGCRISLAFFRTDLKWAPFYVFRINKPGEAEVSLRALLPKVHDGNLAAVALSTLTHASIGTAFPLTGGMNPVVAGFNLPLEDENSSSSPIGPISFRVKNTWGRRLPPGNCDCFVMGAYWGRAHFSGSEAGEENLLVCGDYKIPGQ